MKEDQMTPLERMHAFAKGEPIDRVPCVPDMGVTMAPAYGISSRVYYNDAKAMADVEEWLFRELRQDSVSISTSLRGMAQAMGAQVCYPEHGISYLLKPVIDSPEQAENLPLIDPTTMGNLPQLLETIQILQKRIGKEVEVGAAMSGPFSVAASVCGTENLLRWMVRRPQAVHQMMQTITENNNRYIDALANLGIAPGFADPVSSLSLISPKQFKTFSFPYLQANVQHILKKTGSRPGLHICGKSRGIWKDLIELGIGNFSLDNIESMEEAKEVLGPHMVITGNIPPIEGIAQGDQETIYNQIRNCIAVSWDSPKGFILSTGCQIPMDTPLEKVQIMMQGCREFGTFPIDIEKLHTPYVTAKNQGGAFDESF